MNEISGAALVAARRAPLQEEGNRCGMETKLINDVRVIVARWRPFIEAVQSEMQKPASAN